MQDQHHLHAMSQPTEGSYATQPSLQPALHQHQHNQADLHSEPDYGQSESQRMLHSSQRPAHEQYHPQVPGMYDQQTGQRLMSDMGEPKQDLVALPFPQPSLNAYGQPLDPQHPGHMESATSLGQHHGSCSGSEFPSNSPEGALSPGDGSRKYAAKYLVTLHKKHQGSYACSGPAFCTRLLTLCCDCHRHQSHICPAKHVRLRPIAPCQYLAIPSTCNHHRCLRAACAGVSISLMASRLLVMQCYPQKSVTFLVFPAQATLSLSNEWCSTAAMSYFSSCRPRGRPPGSKNRKTLLKEAGLLSDDPNNMEGMESHPLLAAPPAKKRGRPPGSKNKKTLEAIQLKAETGGLEPVVQPVDPIPEEAVTVAAAASGILEITPSKPRNPPSSSVPATLASTQ